MTAKECVLVHQNGVDQDIVALVILFPQSCRNENENKSDCTSSSLKILSKWARVTMLLAVILETVNWNLSQHSDIPV
jgi:hypothetical protein